MGIEEDLDRQKDRVVADLSERIGAAGRSVLQRLPLPELCYLSQRPDLQERYAAPGRGPGLLEWEMSAVERGEQALREIESCVGFNGPATVALDAGCGDGGFLIAMARRGVQAHGVDLCEGNVVGAALRGRAWRLPIAPVIGNTVSLPYPSAAFHLVTCGDVIEHVREPARALEEIARILQPGGILWLAAPTRYHWRNLWRDPHYGFLGVSVLPRRAAAWYLARVRRVFAAPQYYEVERLPTYRGTIAALRELGFEILAGEHRRSVMLRDPRRIQSRWKKAWVGGLLAVRLRGLLRVALSLEAELAHPIRLICRKP